MSVDNQKVEGGDQCSLLPPPPAPPPPPESPVKYAQWQNSVDDLPDILGLRKDRRFQKELQFRMVGAIEKRDLMLLKRLVVSGVDVNAIILYCKTPLSYAAELGYSDIARFLLSVGADVEKPEQVTWRRKPIHLAAMKNMCAFMMEMIENGADVNGRDAIEMTALHYAAHYGHAQLLKYLINNNADVNAVDNVGRCALHRAAEEKHTEIIDMLLEAGASVNSSDAFGWTPIYHSIMWNDTKTVDFLLSRGADVNVSDNKGNSPLHIVCSRIRRENSVIVLQTSFDFYRRTKRIPSEEFKVVLQMKRKTDLDMLKVIINVGADVNIRNENYECPIHRAEKGQFVRYLVLAGARINAGMLMTDSEEGDVRSVSGRSWDLHIWLHEQYQLQSSMIRICRHNIRSVLGATRNISGAIDCLTLPRKIKDYLKLCDFEDCNG